MRSISWFWNSSSLSIFATMSLPFWKRMTVGTLLSFRTLSCLYGWSDLPLHCCCSTMHLMTFSFLGTFLISTSSIPYLALSQSLHHVFPFFLFVTPAVKMQTVNSYPPSVTSCSICLNFEVWVTSTIWVVKWDYRVFNLSIFNNIILIMEKLKLPVERV